MLFTQVLTARYNIIYLLLYTIYAKILAYNAIVKFPDNGPIAMMLRLLIIV